MSYAGLIEVDHEIQGGTPVFVGTRVPVQSLLDHLKEGVSLDEFLADFPSVRKEQAVELLSKLGRMLDSSDQNLLNAFAA